MRQQLIYKGYSVTQSILTREWYADPATAITTEYRLKATTAIELRVLIDAVVDEQRLNPWQLPSVGQEVAKAA
jgi:hypothetical protein